MISAIINNCLKFKSLTNCVQNDSDFVNNWNSIHFLRDNLKSKQFLNKCLFKFKVNAIESQVKDITVNTNIDSNVHITQEEDFGSKEYIERVKTLSIWESIQYLFHRKVDKNDQKYQKSFTKEGETGEDRIKMMFGEYFNGGDTPEMRFIMSSVGWGALGGFIYGGIIGNRTAVQDFVRRHNEYVFRGEFEAKRKIRDTMYLQFVKAGARWSWRIALFSGTLTGLTSTAIAYRNDIYISDCVISGALVCSLWKMKLGLRAMAVSGVLGSLFGAVFGASLKLMLWTFNTTVPEYRYWRHLRYTQHLEVEKYSDGTTEYDWNVDRNSPQKQPNYQNLSPNSSSK